MWQVKILLGVSGLRDARRCLIVLDPAAPTGRATPLIDPPLLGGKDETDEMEVEEEEGTISVPPVS